MRKPAPIIYRYGNPLHLGSESSPAQSAQRKLLDWLTDVNNHSLSSGFPRVDNRSKAIRDITIRTHIKRQTAVNSLIAETNILQILWVNAGQDTERGHKDRRSRQRQTGRPKGNSAS
jgi:hypothetical protein